MTVHIYHYNTHGEKRYFLGKEHHSLYDVIALNGNIVSLTPNGVAGFLSTSGKPFYIDPQTYAFQYPTIHLKADVSDKDKGEEPRFEFKPSIVKLAVERLGSIFANVITTDRPIHYAAFYNNNKINLETIDEVCSKIINFQLNTMIDEVDAETREYIEGNSNLTPQFIIAPYFSLTRHTWSKWFEINLCCFKRTKELCKQTPVFMAIVISRDLLSNYNTICDQIASMKPDGIVLWIDDFIEEYISDSEITNYIELLRELRKCTKTIYISHGGYLSLLLSRPETKGLVDGVGHSVNYGEHRGVVPIGGGIPMARFYLLSVHSRLRFGDAAGIAVGMNWLASEKIYRDKICKCRQCVDLFSTNKSAEKVFYAYGDNKPVTIRRRSGSIVRLEYPTKEAKQIATRHYLYNKAEEFKDVNEQSLNVLLQNLETTYNEIASQIGEEFVSHLLTWCQNLDCLTK
jgi:hypothetical protein